MAVVGSSWQWLAEISSDWCARNSQNPLMWFLVGLVCWLGPRRQSLSEALRGRAARSIVRGRRDYGVEVETRPLDADAALPACRSHDRKVMRVCLRVPVSGFASEHSLPALDRQVNLRMEDVQITRLTRSVFKRESHPPVCTAQRVSAPLIRLASLLARLDTRLSGAGMARRDTNKRGLRFILLYIKYDLAHRT